ncbi:hypothetical protein ACER0C_002023 [Sarotherodon galilaeus]
MGATLLCELGLFLLCTLLCTGHAQDAVLTTVPRWIRLFFIREYVTFKCDMNEGEETEWEYKFNKDGQQIASHFITKEYKFEMSSTGDSGEYQCFGLRMSSRDTKKSNTVSITVLDRPTATLTAGTTTIPVGGNVTLTCSVQSSGWDYEWFRRTKRTYERQIRDQQYSKIIVSQGGIYSCKGTRENIKYYPYESHISDDVTIEITFSIKVVVKQQPNWPQIFRGETITLTCEMQEGGETEWFSEWRGPGTLTQMITDNFWTFRVSEYSSGDYMCKNRRGDDRYSSTEWSEPFTLSVSNQPKAQITSDMRDVPVGGNVTLKCSVNPSSYGWKYYWCRDENWSEPLTTQDAVFHSNGQITFSQEGLYRCRGGRGNPVYYTEDSEPFSTDKTTSSSSFLVLMITGLISGMIFIFLLFLYKKKCSADDPKVSQDENQQVYSSLFHGEDSVYETIRDSGNTQNGG